MADQKITFKAWFVVKENGDISMIDSGEAAMNWCDGDMAWFGPYQITIPMPGRYVACPVADLTPTICPRTGRWTWPHIVQYRLRDGTILDCPPTAVTHPAESTPVPLDCWGKAKMIAEGEVKPLPNGQPYTDIVHDLHAYEALKATGAVGRREHTGAAGAEMVDNSRTS